MKKKTFYIAYDYTIENRLNSVKQNGRLLMAALYDGNGDRVFSINLKDNGNHNGWDNGNNGNHYGWDNNWHDDICKPLYLISFSLHCEYGSQDWLTDCCLRNVKSSWEKCDDEPIFIPGIYSFSWRGNYEVTSYVNDINQEYTQVLMEYGSSKYDKTAYTYGNQRESADSYCNKDYYMYDGRGSVSNTTSQYGKNVVSYAYDAFGNPYSSSNNISNPYGYNAESYDDITGLQYLRARYYDPATGRFISQDTLFGEMTNPLTQNLYTYCGNNPLNLIDPSGHFFKEIGIGIIRTKKK